MTTIRIFYGLCVGLCLLTPVADLQAQGTDERVRALEETVRRQQAMLDTAQRERQEALERMGGDLEAFGTALNQLRTEVENLRKQNAQLARANDQLSAQIKTLHENDKTLQTAIGAEGEARATADARITAAVDKEINRVIEDVNRSTGAAIQAANAASADAARAAQQAAAQRAAEDRRSSQQAAAAPAGGEYILYTVVKGDTLSAIATAAKVTVAEIMAANNLTSDTIRIDQQLRIPKK